MNRNPAARPSLAWLIAYSFAAVLIMALWTDRAKTEKQSNDWGSIVALADGSARIPFVKCRLLADSANTLARMMPTSAWNRVSNAIDVNRLAAKAVRQRLGWSRENDPILISATFLMGLSAFGFMIVMRSMIVFLYETTSRLASLAGLLLGLALLGEGGDRRFGWFPYDLPHAFIFSLGLTMVLMRSVWLLPVFAVAVYSKETAVLLIPAYLLVHFDKIDRTFFFDLAPMGLTFWLIRSILDASFGPGDGGFWFLGRNARVVASWLAYDSWWYAPLLIVTAVRIAHVWSEFPLPLRRLTVLAIVPLGIALVKGSIEEKGQYLELLPILGPLSLQWLAIELGLSKNVRAKENHVYDLKK